MSNTSWWRDPGELDDEQTDVISLEPEGNFLVVGPPGSGKTNLLLLRASYLVDAQLPNVVVLMFTRSLREFVVRGSVHYSFAEDKVKTIMRWGQDLVREHGGDVPDESMSFEESRLALAKEVKAIFARKPGLRHHLDCILVDEVQDCLPEEIELFFVAAKNVFLVGDDRQQIYAKTGSIDALKGRVVRKELTKHYRNGEAICRVADVIGQNFGEQPLLGSCNYNELKAKSDVVFEACKDEAEMFRKLGARLTQQLKAYPDELLGVACPRNVDVAKVRAALESLPQIASHLLPDGEFSNSAEPDQRIYISTMHAAKGLEFRAFHLLFVENLSRMGSVQKRLAFTSVTRAKTTLSVYHVAPLPGYIEQARDRNAPPRPLPAVSSLFPTGRKK